jgi:hypothetical protein
MDPEDDSYARAVVKVVGDLTKRVDDYEQSSKEDRAAFKTSIESTMVKLRTDFWDTTIKIQRDAAIHRDEHIVERKERAADLIQRIQRQTTVDIWMGALTLLGLINIILVLYLALRSLP